MDDTCTLAHVFLFQTNLCAAAQNAGAYPFLMSLAGRMCGWRTCSSPKSGSENMPNSLNAMATTKSEVINHAAKWLNTNGCFVVDLGNNTDPANAFGMILSVLEQANTEQ